ncbi:hypothetical protein CIPAW_06G067600 [Carya illinoinensis]|uniref:ATP-dependent DNA helicase n=1 Tax=Carya illinoinensis TaxID=32201 RepID=A0A8T1Q8Q6_CARIL|nr:hypothetical protein CIPAW_06G067600 [Carya illinoinensis]
MHGLCGALNPTNVCMKKNGHCKNNYPRHFVPNTTIGNDCFPIYKRSDDGRTVTIRGRDLDNYWVVPYNSYLLAMFDYHINVEICSTIKAVKYLYKYIYKDNDPMWRIYGFIINEVHPTVYSLHLHLENQHLVTFRAHENLNNVIRFDLSTKSTLTEFFSTSQVDENTRKLLYKEFPEFYVWSQQYKMWTIQKKQVIGGIVTANPSEGLLSFDDLKTEVSLYQMPSNLRQLFATILIYCNPTNPRYLWEHFEQDMSSDFQLTEDSQSNMRMQMNFCLERLMDELAVFIPEEDITASTLLNREQQIVYNLVLEKVFSNQKFLYKALLATIRSRHLIAIATASSGAATSVLPGDSNKNFICSVSKQSGLAKLLQITKLIIWDEAPISRKEAIEALDRMLKDVNDSELSFSRKVVIFEGDFRQILPVVPKGTSQQQIDASLVSSYLWPTLTKICLTENMRARLDPDFSNYILELGNGMPPITIDEYVKIPIAMLIPYQNDTASLDQLLDVVFNDISEYSINISSMMNHAILTPKNSYAIMEDFLNTLTPNGFPPHQLLLKQNCPIMLLRNINPSEGLCNGTRLICRNFDHNVIHAEIVIGHQTDKKVFIPRIPFLPRPDENSGFPFKRTQFPIRLSFAISINKSQRQTLDFVGIYLPQPVFSHGQLYVALSRAKTISVVKILIQPISMEEPENNSTKNIVYTELLTIAASD